MTLTPKILFEIPIYRLSPQEYSKQLEDFIEKNRKNVHPDIANNPVFEQIYTKDFGGGWKYNEIIGYIVISTGGSEDTRILGKSFILDSKLITRTRKKIFKLGDNSVFQIWAGDYYNKNNELIFNLLSNTISNIKAESNYKKYYIDDSLFQVVGKFLDWNGLLNS